VVPGLTSTPCKWTVCHKQTNRGDVQAAAKSLQNKAPGEDGTPVSVFRGQYKAAEDQAPDADPGVRRKEVEGAVDLYADTLAGAFNHATHTG
jgi:hypothetical protein